MLGPDTNRSFFISEAPSSRFSFAARETFSVSSYRKTCSRKGWGGPKPHPEDALSCSGSSSTRATGD